MPDVGRVLRHEGEIQLRIGPLCAACVCVASDPIGCIDHDGARKPVAADPIKGLASAVQFLHRRCLFSKRNAFAGFVVIGRICGEIGGPFLARLEDRRPRERVRWSPRPNPMGQFPGQGHTFSWLRAFPRPEPGHASNEVRGKIFVEFGEGLANRGCYQKAVGFGEERNVFT